MFIAKAQDMFKPVNQGGLGPAKMKQLFEFSNFRFNNATQFKNLLNNNAQFRNNALKFIKTE